MLRGGAKGYNNKTPRPCGFHPARTQLTNFLAARRCVSPTQIINKKIRCALVHDHILLRQGLRRLLEDEPDLRVVAEAGNAAEALRMIFEHRPEVVIAAAHIFECAADQIEQMILRESANNKKIGTTT